MNIEWTQERMLPDENTSPGFDAKITRPADGAAILGSLMPPGHEFNDGPGWSYSLAWDTGEDPEISVDAHLMAEAPDEATARRRCGRLIPIRGSPLMLSVLLVVTSFVPAPAAPATLDDWLDRLQCRSLPTVTERAACYAEAGRQLQAAKVPPAR